MNINAYCSTNAVNVLIGITFVWDVACGRIEERGTPGHSQCHISTVARFTGCVSRIAHLTLVHASVLPYIHLCYVVIAVEFASDLSPTARAVNIFLNLFHARVQHCVVQVKIAVLVPLDSTIREFA